jgi:hypothetical protein
MVGRTLGHYEIIEPLGAGGKGEVWRISSWGPERDIELRHSLHHLLRN